MSFLCCTPRLSQLQWLTCLHRYALIAVIEKLLVILLLLKGCLGLLPLQKCHPHSCASHIRKIVLYESVLEISAFTGAWALALARALPLEAPLEHCTLQNVWNCGRRAHARVIGFWWGSGLAPPICPSCEGLYVVGFAKLLLIMTCSGTQLLQGLEPWPSRGCLLSSSVCSCIFVVIMHQDTLGRSTLARAWVPALSGVFLVFPIVPRSMKSCNLPCREG